MPIPVSCPGCKANFKAPDQMAGRQASCPKCQTKLQIPALATATALPMAKAIPSPPANKPPLPPAQQVNVVPTITPAIPTNAAVQNAPPAEQPPAKESIWKKKWTADKIIINIIAIIIFIWVMKGAAEVLFTGLERNQQVQPRRD